MHKQQRTTVAFLFLPFFFFFFFAFDVQAPNTSE